MDNHRDNRELARAYIRIQYYHKRWDPIKGLIKGTIFPELYRPYYPKKICDSESHFPTKRVYLGKSVLKNASMRGGKEYVKQKEKYAF